MILGGSPDVLISSAILEREFGDWVLVCLLAIPEDLLAIFHWFQLAQYLTR